MRHGREGPVIPADLAFLIKSALEAHSDSVKLGRVKESGRDHACRFDVEDLATGDLLTITIERAYVPMCRGAS